jgi:CRISPR system Cascade subunit CasE
MMTEEHELYLSRLLLNPRSREVRRDLGNCHELHCTILRALPQVEDNGAKARERFGVLHRLELDQRQQKLTLLVQSFLKPAWSRLPSDYLLFSDEENPACKPVHETYSRLGAGQCLTFRVRANPTRRVSEKNTQEAQWHGKRVEIRDEEQQIAWLQRKGKEAGFKLASVRINPTVPNVNLAPQGKLFGYRRSSQETSAGPADEVFGSNRRMAFDSVLFEGELIVTDVEAFREALVKGIGSGKAYGFGLLSIARPVSF